MLELNDQEVRALNEFVGYNWAEFLRVSKDYLTEAEAEALADKLGGN